MLRSFAVVDACPLSGQSTPVPLIRRIWQEGTRVLPTVVMFVLNLLALTAAGTAGQPIL
jgi:hypothetical protein